MLRPNSNPWAVGGFLAALLALGVGVGPAPGQGQPPGGSNSGSTGTTKKPRSQLEEWLERAAANHADIKVAEAKLRTAAAELERARSLVMQQVLSLHHAIQAQKIEVEKAQIEIRRVEQLAEVKAGTRAELDKARSDLIANKAKLEELQAQMDHLIGKGKADSRTQAESGLRWLAAAQALDQAIAVKEYEQALGLSLWTMKSRPVVPGPMADRIRKALDRPVNIDATRLELHAFLALLQKQEPGLLIQVKGPQTAVIDRAALKDLPLGAVLQWVEDFLPNHRIVVREYGLLIAPDKEVPLGAVSLVDFWKGGAAKAPASTSGGK